MSAGTGGSNPVRRILCKHGSGMVFCDGAGKTVRDYLTVSDRTSVRGVDAQQDNSKGNRELPYYAGAEDIFKIVEDNIVLLL